MKKSIFIMTLMALVCVVGFAIADTSYNTTNKLQYLSFESYNIDNFTAIDTLGNLNGTIIGAVVNVEGQAYEALSFVNDTNEVDTNINPDYFNDTLNFTIMVWAYSDNASQFRGLFGNLDVTNKGIGVAQFNGTGTPMWSVWDGVWQNSTAEVETQTWTHIAIVHNTDYQNTELYVNGVSALTIETAEWTNSANNLIVGSLYKSAYNNTRWSGYIDEFFFSTDALSEAQVQDAYDQGVAGFLLFGCSPVFMCGGYEACGDTDTADCNESTDVNQCGIEYTGDLSEFDPQDCNYCSYSVAEDSVTDCYWDDTVFGKQNTTYIDENYETCCDVTGITTDCTYSGYDYEYVNSEGYFNVEGVTATSCGTQYDTADVSPILFDGIGKTLLTIIGFVFLAGVGVVAYLGVSLFRKTKYK